MNINRWLRRFWLVVLSPIIIVVQGCCCWMEFWQAQEQPATADGCSGLGRPSCKATECMMGLDKNLEPKHWSCAFTDQVIPNLIEGLTEMHEGHMNDVEGLINANMATQAEKEIAVAKARSEEREECAQIADAYDDSYDNMAPSIAGAIRRRETKVWNS